MQNINNNKIKEVHVTFDGNVFGEVKYYLAKQGKKEHEDYELFELFEYLTYGDISNIPLSTSQVISHWYKDVEQVNKTNNDFADKLKTMPSTAKIKVWLAPKISEQFINFCYWSELFKRFDNIEIIRLDFGKTNKNCDITDTIETTKRLTKNDLNIYSELWKNAERENSAIRYVKDEKIYSVDEAFFDEQILSQITNKYKKFGKIYSDAHAEIEKKFGLLLSYETFQEIMIRLATNKKILSEHPVGFNENDHIFIDNSFKIAKN